MVSFTELFAYIKCVGFLDLYEDMWVIRWNENDENVLK